MDPIIIWGIAIFLLLAGGMYFALVINNHIFELKSSLRIAEDRRKTAEVSWGEVRRQLIEEQMRTKALEGKVKDIAGQKKSSEVRLGRVAEQVVPFLEVFKHDPEKCIFLGQPIDYIVFNDDDLTFVEVKSGNARLTKKQSQIKKLIKEGKVKFDVVRVNETPKKAPEEVSEM